ncbi:hypothetical protein ANABIO32_02290 [Rossellomorea marisflavi]|uniref:hypothetical protein n=1 Tax=Rossellomorea marisflavi TaxID=189381 RepID=UPI0025CA9C62|nr:hypothetical protein [Rossellomorea marisflavi]GLI82542.1 hypothetical protein ANABIO32_02290 [Rossellomorea marisflavi]
MSKQFYCEIDKSVFSTEEELLKHIKKKFVKVFENKDHEPNDLLSTLQREFPDYEVHIREGGGWYSEYVIELSKGNGTITQHFGSDGRDPGFRQNNPLKIEQLFNQINEKIDTYESILRQVDEKYSFAKFEFQGFTYGYSDDEHSYAFEFKVKESDQSAIEQYFPYEDELDDFINSLNKYFVKVLEGKPDSFYDDGYFIDYSIDGVQIGKMMTKKKVRLEVIED